MKYKFKRLLVVWRNWDWLIALLAFFLLFAVLLFVGHNTKKKNPMDSTSAKGIEAKSFEYKGHRYIQFEKSDFFGSTSVLHDPDCPNDN